MCRCHLTCGRSCCCSCHRSHHFIPASKSVAEQYAEACDEVFRLRRELADAEVRAERLYARKAVPR